MKTNRRLANEGHQYKCLTRSIIQGRKRVTVKDCGYEEMGSIPGELLNGMELVSLFVGLNFLPVIEVMEKYI